MSKYSIEDTTLTAIADSVRAKAGTSDPILVSELPTAIAAIPTGGGSAVDFLTNETDYGCVWYEPTSNTTAARGITLPDNVTLEDIKFIIGLGGYNNSNVTCYNDSRFLTYIYCPDLYNFTLQKESNGDIYHACIGSVCIGYGSNYFHGIDYGRGYQAVVRGATQQYYFGWITYDETDHSIYLWTSPFHSTETPEGTMYQGYMVSQYGRVAIIYDKRGAA